jgi:stage III sporulation protein AE
VLEEQLNLINLDEVSAVLQSTGESGKMNIRDIAEHAVNGNLEISPQAMLDYAGKIFFSEITDNLSVIRNLIIIAILAALLKNLSESFKNKSVGELGFYAGYIMTVTILFSSFKIAVSAASDMIINLSSFMGASVPVVAALSVMTGNAAASYAISPTIFFLANAVTGLIRDFILPGIIMASSVSVVNYLSGREVLTKLTELFKNGLSLCLKILAVLFMGVISLQRLSAAEINTVMGRTAKSAINLVPVVGETLSASVDTYLHWAKAAKSGIIVAVFFAVSVSFALPVIKIAVLCFIYKLTAGLIQPVSDERLVKCIDTVGSYTALILSACLTVVIMFLFALMIVLSL